MQNGLAAGRYLRTGQGRDRVGGQALQALKQCEASVDRLTLDVRTACGLNWHRCRSAISVLRRVHPRYLRQVCLGMGRDRRERDGRRRLELGHARLEHLLFPFLPPKRV
jgi:hypothetical protein